MDSLQLSFPKLNQHQKTQLNTFIEEIKEWNKIINLISRKEADKVIEHHLFPSLALMSLCPFKPKETVLDIGSGGGFPGIPLAICFPETHFTLVDSIGKKIKVIKSIVEKLGLTNVHPLNARVENIKENFDYVTGRAVTALPQFLEWAQPRLKKSKETSKHGVYYLKGGPLEPELQKLNLLPRASYPLSSIIEGEFYEGKYVAFFSTHDIRSAFHKKPYKR